MRSYAEDTSAAGRQIMPDLVRAWALFGICLVNVGVLAWPMGSSYNFEGGLVTSADQAAYFGVNALFLMKSYSLFSLMFGVGFAYQMESASRKGVGFGGRYWRRIIGLLAFGFLNIALFFIGDILVIYAVLGSILFLFRNASAKALWRWGIGIYAFQILLIGLFAASIWAGNAYAPEEMAKMAADFEEMDTTSLEVFGSGSFADAVMFRLTKYLEDFPFFIIFQGFGALAFFLIGFAVVKTGRISDPSAAIWKRSRWVFLPIGLIISATGAWFILQADGFSHPMAFTGIAIITLGSPFSSFGYLGLIAKFAEGPGGPIRTFLARGGTASLTAYLMQNAILSFTFSAYGLGLFAKLPAAQTIAIAAGVALFTVVFASLWRLVFSRGPLESILRGWTYLGSR